MSRQDELLALVMSSGNSHLIDSYTSFIEYIERELSIHEAFVDGILKDKTILIRKLIAMSTSKNSSDPIINFLFTEWVGMNYTRLHKGWVHKYSDQTNKLNLLTTKEVYDLWVQTIN